MFNRNTTWYRLSNTGRSCTMFLSCIVLMGQFATAQGTFLLSENHDTGKLQKLQRMGPSVFGERIVSVTCDPFMTVSQEQSLMQMLLKQDDTPWLNISLNQLKALLSNICNVSIDKKAIEEESISIDDVLLNEVPTGFLWARLSTLLGSNQLTYNLRQNRLEITSKKFCVPCIPRIYDVTPLVRSVSNDAGSHATVLAHPLIELIETMICPDCWQSAGGNCTVRGFLPPSSSDCVCLIVLNSTENHLAIQNLLDQFNSFGIPPRPSAVESKRPVQANPLQGWRVDRLDVNKF